MFSPLLEKVSVQLGIAFTLGHLLYMLTMWIIAAMAEIRVLEVSIFVGADRGILRAKSTIPAVVYNWFPSSTHLKISGFVPEDPEEVMQEYDFRAKPMWVRLMVILFPLLVLMIAGSVLIHLSGGSSVGQTMSLYLQANFFLISMEESAVLWQQILEEPMFQMGFMFLFLGASNILTNVGKIFYQVFGPTSWIQVLFSFSSLTVMIGLFRFASMHFSLLGLVCFYGACMGTGFIGFIGSIFMKSILPNPAPIHQEFPNT
ncbi:hypothetical protein [Pontibacter sp. G13]|uniref:hypothetical protein n=1 Tax=Pontibacter sp. G13 TaxID=3074898 RepID=UPI00288BBF4D|nr:hypothetical protein [Pontibacter sp. G13]WNJ18672.1 hypothetical protein RJD25_27770 [Pontibacter sp. G13]